MGWASGTELASELFDIILPHVASGQKEIVVKEVLELFECHDCDTLRELYDHDDETVSEIVMERYNMEDE